MRIIVTHDNIRDVKASLLSIEKGVIACDTETFGLKFDDKMFALQLAVLGGDSYYFNFNNYPEEQGAPILEYSILKALYKLWINSNIRWVFANAKFDLRKLWLEGITLNGEVYDVLLMERIKYNKHFSYSLDSCLKRISSNKNDKVSLWIKDNKSYTTYTVPGKKTKEKNLHYDRVPFSIMQEYGFDDVESTLVLYRDQAAYFSEPDNNEQLGMLISNLELTKAVFDMESRGICIDRAYCHIRIATLVPSIETDIREIEAITGHKYEGGPKWLTKVLAEQGITVSLSDKGNAELDSSALEAMDNAVASYVISIREKEKEISFYHTLLRHAIDGVIHTNYRLNGTDTLRFSSSDPNLQNIPACKKGVTNTVRHAFKPRPDFYFVSIDYSSMEFRLCVDFAGEIYMIDAIKNGLDPHQMVADSMGADRKAAKTLNFLTLYGGGAQKLADSLGCDLERAKVLRHQYYLALPRVKQLHNDAQAVSRSRGYVRNKYGMRFYLNDDNFAYKMVNHLIQGTGACIIRSAMNKLHYFLEGTKSKMVLQVHDELLFEIHKDELFIIPELKRIMEAEYEPYHGMYMECDVAISKESWNENTFTKWSESWT
jgi:DNA polymerase I